MLSIRTKTTLLTVIAVSIAMTVATIISAISIANNGHASAQQELTLLCETGKNNINYYLKSAEQSVNTVSSLVDSELNSLKEEDFNDSFKSHVSKAKATFTLAAENTNSVFTYYYRIDPSITAQTDEKGFWFTRTEDGKFAEHEVTDLSDDRFECPWFYKPKESGSPLWIGPYITENLDSCVLSYNAPVFHNQSFVGVVGIEISYETLGEQIKDIKLNETGFAFIVDSKTASIIYHPYIDILNLPEEQRPEIPTKIVEAFEKSEHSVTYSFNGVEKRAHWLYLSNGMSIIVSSPVSEIDAAWIRVLFAIIVAAAIVEVTFAIVAILYSRRITKPLQELTLAAERINEDDFDVQLENKANDEIGVLTKAVNKLIKHLHEYISDLSSLAYADALTSARNKGAFDLKVKEMQTNLQKKQSTDEPFEFGIAMFDCDNLKEINDEFGHAEGDVYLKNSSNLICRVFKHSPVFRIGGDEFVVILTGEDFQNRDELKTAFLEKSERISTLASNPWEEIHVSVGIAVYDKNTDKGVDDVIARADRSMYEHKRSRKEGK